VTPRSFPDVPVLWPNGTVVCIGSGPSLTTADVDYCRGRADGAIAINTSYQRAPWASVLYAADDRWWEWHKGAPEFKGLKYSLKAASANWPGVQVLENTGLTGLEVQPSGLRTGHDSGYQAINLAVHLGAVKILLLGYDMQRGPNGETHWHGDHKSQHEIRYDTYRDKYPSLVEPLKRLGISVINCTRRTALTVFPQMAIEEALC
jgi:hypothetical protein